MSSSKSLKLHRTEDWSNLPDGILTDIFALFHTLHDFFAVRAVCRNWRIAATSSPHSLSSQSHFLLASSHNGSLFDILDRRLYSLRLPWTPSQRQILGYSHGHLITSDFSCDNIVFRHLFTGAQITLPPNPKFFNRILLSDRPDSNNCLVITWGRCFNHILNHIQYIRVGDTQWTVLSWPPQLAESVVRMMFFRGELVALTYDMEVFSVELIGDSLTVSKLGGGGVVAVKEGKKYNNIWIGELDGVMLAIGKYECYDEFDAFRWNSEKMKWEKIRDLGDKSLFISQIGSVVPISATGSGLRKNCVYFVSYEVAAWYEFSLEERSCKILSVGSRSARQKIYCSGWIFPDCC